MLTQELALSLLSQSDPDKYAYCLHVFIHLKITRFLAVDTKAYSSPVDTIDGIHWKRTKLNFLTISI